MTTREALIKLRDKLRDGNKSNGAKFMEAFGEYHQRKALLRAYMDAANGSTDAAIALAESVLPEWEWFLGQDGPENYAASTWPKGGTAGGRFLERNKGVAATPARALLLCILGALIAQEPTDD